MTSIKIHVSFDSSFFTFRISIMGDDSEYPEAYYLDDKSRKVDAATLRVSEGVEWEFEDETC